jgi:hypothetical protein
MNQHISRSDYVCAALARGLETTAKGLGLLAFHLAGMTEGTNGVAEAPMRFRIGEAQKALEPNSRYCSSQQSWNGGLAQYV